MKKLLLLIFALAAVAMQAQNGELYSLLYHGDAQCRYNIRSFMQQRDGDFVMETYIFDNNGSFLRNMFYKISLNPFIISDSLLTVDASPSYYFLSQNPNGEGNIRASYEYREDCDSTFLRIGHFPDDDLHTNPDEDIVVPLCEGYVSGEALVDCWGDLILQYYKYLDASHYDEFVARFDIAGVLKCQALLHENQVGGMGAGQLHVLNESPLNYYQWGHDDSSYPFNLVVYVIDSLFHQSPIVFNPILSQEVIDPYHTAKEYLSFNGFNEVIPVGGDDIFVAAQYIYDTTSHPTTAEYGVAVAKYDLRTMQLKDYVVFNDHPGYYKRAECLGIKMMTDGTVYFLYKEDGYPNESFMAVKMDANLNVDWKRFCKTDNIVLYPPFYHSVLYKNEQGEEKGIAWVGYGKKDGNTVMAPICLLLNHDGPVNVADETVMEVRPYCFYPNPAKDQLRMEFSPDVQPAKVDLYDLQGRLVRTQRSGLERIDMSRLPAGTYMMRVTMEDGKSYSDKVVKE